MPATARLHQLSATLHETGGSPDTQAARGRKRRAKTDRSDARLLRELLQSGELPASWIPPEGVLEWRERVRLYVSLVKQRTLWCQRIHAELYQHGVAVPEGAIRTSKTRAMLDESLELSPAGRQRITVGYRMIDAARSPPRTEGLDRLPHTGNAGSRIVRVLREARGWAQAGIRCSYPVPRSRTSSIRTRSGRSTRLARWYTSSYTRNLGTRAGCANGSG